MGVMALACIVTLIMNKNEFLTLMAQNVLGAIIGAGLIDIFVEFFTKEQKEEDITDRIMSALCPDKDLNGEMPVIGTLYNRDSISHIMQNSIMAYTGSDYMSKAYKAYISHSFNAIKADENYKVTISEQNGRYLLCQDLFDRFVIEDSDTIDIKAFFVLGECRQNKSQLDKLLSDDSYLFREEISDSAFIEESLRPKLNDKDAVLDLLNFSLSIFDKQNNEHKIEKDKIDMELSFDESEDGGKICIGISFCYRLYKKFDLHTSKNKEIYIEKQTPYYSTANHISFLAKFHVKYPISDEQNHFHLVYARPTVAPTFALIFENIHGFVASKVNYLTFLSFDSSPDKPKDGEVRIHGNAFEFHTDRLILPRSGISFSWNFRKTLSRLEQQFMDYGLVNINPINQNISIRLMYGTNDNFLGRNLYNDMKGAYFAPEIALMLSNVQKALDQERPGYRLCILDAARPVSIQEAMFNYAVANGKEQYVANPRIGGFHNYGLAVDLTILNENGKDIDMGCKFDTFSELAHFGNEDALVRAGLISPEAAANRRFLHELMLEQGFTHNPDEWWHFQKYTIPEAQKQFRLLDF